jgi:DNA-directed RNA polymerase specialized sigma24 family protein
LLRKTDRWGALFAVKDELISEALKYLPEKKRNVILLSFFLDMTDTEIAERMNLVRSTIHHHRVHSLKLLGQIMERIKDGKNT